MSSNETDIVPIDNTNIYIPRELRFWILLPVNLASLTCSLFQLYHLLTKRVLRIALNNHSIIALLFVGLTSQLIDIPFYITYIRLGYVWPQTPFFCRFWWYIDMEAFEGTVFLVMWISVERHILIFHEKWLLNRKKRWFLHYLPLIFFIIYPPLFYLLILIFVTCDYPSSYDYTQAWCYYSAICFDDITLARYDILMNWLSCTVITFLSDIILIIRVIWQRRMRLHQPIQWRKHRKMIVQLLSVSLFASSFSTPLLIFYLVLNFGNLSANLSPTVQLCLLYGLLFSILFLPFIMILSLPKEYWLDKWKKIFCDTRRRQRRVGPIAAIALNPVANPLRRGP